MANVSHSAITDPNIHEPKGVATATSGKVYTANGSGSGTWSLPYPPGISGASNGQVFVANGSGGGSWQGQAGAANCQGHGVGLARRKALEQLRGLAQQAIGLDCKTK